MTNLVIIISKGGNLSRGNMSSPIYFMESQDFELRILDLELGNGTWINTDLKG